MSSGDEISSSIRNDGRREEHWVKVARCYVGANIHHQGKTPGAGKGKEDVFQEFNGERIRPASECM